MLRFPIASTTSSGKSDAVTLGVGSLKRTRFGLTDLLPGGNSLNEGKSLSTNSEGELGDVEGAGDAITFLLSKKNILYEALYFMRCEDCDKEQCSGERKWFVMLKINARFGGFSCVFWFPLLFAFLLQLAITPMIQ